MLIPPLRAKWGYDPSGSYKLLLTFSWAVLNSSGVVGPALLPTSSALCMLQQISGLCMKASIIARMCRMHGLDQSNYEAGRHLLIACTVER